MSEEFTRPFGFGSEEAVVDALRHVLGNTCRLAMTTLSYHWNVRGPHFHSRHVMFESQYRELWEALDPIAERIRALDAAAVPDHADNIVVPVAARPDDLPHSERMVPLLVAGHEAMLIALRSAVDIASEEEDEGTVSLLGERLLAHGKHAWTLRSSLADA